MSTTQKYFERMRPNGWLLYFNCASTFPCLLYIFPLTAVKKKPRKLRAWYSGSMNKQFWGKRKAGSKRRGRLALPMEMSLGYFMPVLSQQQQDLTLSRGECLRYLSLQWKAEPQRFSRRFQSTEPWNWYCVNKRRHLSQCKAWKGPWERSWECKKSAET